MRRIVQTGVLALSILLLTSVPTSAWIAEPTDGVLVACTNTTGDDEAINAAIAASQPGNEIVFSGTCLIDGTIKLAGDRTYRGQSRIGTVIRQADGANLDAMLASDSYVDNVPYTGSPFSMRSVTVIANREGNPGAGDALVVRSWQTVLEDLVVLEANRHAIRLTNLSANGTPLTNTQVNGRITGSHIAASGQRGIYVEDTGNAVTDWQLTDNWIEDSGTDGIALDNAAGWIIRGNHVYGVGEVAILAERLFATSISDNYVEDFVTAGLRVSVQGEAAATITGNRIFRFNGGGGTFLQTRVNYGTGSLAVMGNAVRGNGSGIGLDYQKGPGASLVVTSTGNAVAGVGTPRQVGAGVTVSQGV